MDLNSSNVQGQIAVLRGYSPTYTVFLTKYVKWATTIPKYDAAQSDECVAGI